VIRDHLLRDGVSKTALFLTDDQMTALYDLLFGLTDADSDLFGMVQSVEHVADVAFLDQIRRELIKMGWTGAIYA